MKKVFVIMLAMMLTLNSFAAQKGKRVPMHRMAQSFRAVQKQKRSLAREQVTAYQDGDVLAIEIRGELNPTLIFRNEEGEVVSAYLMTQMEEEIAIPCGACIVEFDCGEYTLIGDLD